MLTQSRRVQHARQLAHALRRIRCYPARCVNIRLPARRPAKTHPLIHPFCHRHPMHIAGHHQQHETSPHDCDCQADHHALRHGHYAHDSQADESKDRFAKPHLAEARATRDTPIAIRSNLDRLSAHFEHHHQ